VGARVTQVEPGDDLRPYFGAADAFVLPAIYDPWPLVALEAMACGLPVLASTKSGAADLVVEHGAGFAVPSADVPALAAAMTSLLDVPTRATLGANARSAVRPFSPAAVALQLVLLYRDLFAASVPVPATLNAA
jgi:UDP-glucose:(heptosyl)LPS alpha-1,3-glucosyltransferase